jgi:hypothetical protein
MEDQRDSPLYALHKRIYTTIHKSFTASAASSPVTAYVEITRRLNLPRGRFSILESAYAASSFSALAVRIIVVCRVLGYYIIIAM